MPSSNTVVRIDFIIEDNSVVDPGFPREAANPKKSQTYYLVHFSKNCMKFFKKLDRVGGHVPSTHIGSANAIPFFLDYTPNINHWFCQMY